MKEKKNFDKMIYDKKSKKKIQIVNKVIIEIINEIVLNLITLKSIIYAVATVISSIKKKKKTYTKAKILNENKFSLWYKKYKLYGPTSSFQR